MRGLLLNTRRVFDANGRLVAVSHHFGKNPYAGLDPLGLSPNMPLGELVLDGIQCPLMASLAAANSKPEP